MAPAQRQWQPAFWWQAALILLPVAVLSAVGWYSLRQDKAIARHDAQDRAQAVANDLALKLWNTLTNWPVPLYRNWEDNSQLGAVAFEVDDAGKLVFPPPFAPVPTPKPLDPAKLSEEQLRLWSAAQYCGGKGESEAAAIHACQEFIDTSPPSEFAANARYGLGLMLKDAGRDAEAASIFETLTNSSDAVGESGVPLVPLARLQLLKLEMLSGRSGSNEDHLAIEAFCSNAVWHPTVLTPSLLQQVGKSGRFAADAATRWQMVWAEFELPRRLYAASRANIERVQTNDRQAWPSLFVKLGPSAMTSAFRQTAGGMPRLEMAGTNAPAGMGAFWFTSEELPLDGAYRRPGSIRERNWLAIPATPPPGDRASRGYLCWPATAFFFGVGGINGGLPDYFGVRIDLAGRTVSGSPEALKIWSPEYYFSKGTGGERKRDTGEAATEVLASAGAGDPATLRVSIYLTSPAALFRRQQARTFWFGLLIAASTVAALIGLLAAWRAFVQQRLLGEMKSNFVSSVSHELRAPIASVRLLAESLERGKVAEPQKQHEYFGFIVQECRRLSSLIENVLDFSRIEQGRKQYEPEPTDVAALLRETVKLMEPYAAEKGVVLALEAPNTNAASSCELSVDGRAIQQALVNLIDNAVKHSPKDETVTVGLNRNGRLPSGPALPSPADGGGRLTPEQAPHPASGHVLLFVEDHGPGIPPEEHERIFERFYRRGSELRRDTQGVGIGLSIVKHIVEAHGGQVLVQSAVGQGSRFIIQLPAKSA